MYSFHQLSPFDFEDLARDLLQNELGLTFESFGPGRDKGIDFRHAKDGESTIIQAKHYVRSGYSALKSALKKEAKKALKLAPSRYILVTSVSMTEARKTEIKNIFAGVPLTESDIFGQEDLNNLLGKFEEVHKAHFKLWMSSTAVLERLLHHASYVESEDEAARIEKAVRVYVQTQSRTQALDVLKKRRLLIVSGAPGVGKSTLARILAWSFMEDGYELISINDFKEALDVINKNKNQIFFFDDFMGQIRLTEEQINHSDKHLPKFIERVSRYPNCYFVLTTREYILRQAQVQSSRLGDASIEMRKHVVDLQEYSRSNRAKIVYNHIFYSDLSQQYVNQLIDDNFFLRIIDHPNFSPRLIEHLTSAEYAQTIEPDGYRDLVISTLDNPELLWARPYESHLSPAGRHLTTVLFFKEDGVAIEELREAFEDYRKALSRINNFEIDELDWSRSLKEAEGTFVEIVNGTVRFPNPSLRDFLDSKLAASSEPLLFAGSSAFVADIIRAIEFLKSHLKKYRSSDRRLVEALRQISKNLSSLPIKRTLHSPRGKMSLVDGGGVATRLELILDLWDITSDQVIAVHLKEFVCRYDDHAGRHLIRDIRFIERLEGEAYSEFPHRDEVLDDLRQTVIGSLVEDEGFGLDLWELSEIGSYLSYKSDEQSMAWRSGLEDEAQRHADEIEDDLFSCETEDDLDTIDEKLLTLEDYYGVSIEYGREKVTERREEIQNDWHYNEDDYDASSFTRQSIVDDTPSIVSLFSTLRN